MTEGEVQPEEAGALWGGAAPDREDAPAEAVSGEDAEPAGTPDSDSEVDSPSDSQADSQVMGHDQLKAAVEAMLFVSDEPVSAARLAQALDIAPGEAASLLEELAADYQEGTRGIQLIQVAGGWRMYTHPAYHEVIERYVLSWDTRKLSQAALEALAVIAYAQPVTRQGVNAIRGVNSEGVISSLVEKGLVREVGRDKTPGSPILYGTTNAFLEKFGLASVADLPPLADFAPDEATRELIADRLSATAPADASGQGATSEPGYGDADASPVEHVSDGTGGEETGSPIGKNEEGDEDV